MIFQQKKFESCCPAVVKSITQELFSFGFVPTVIGGIPRDFLLTGLMGDDWDFELTHPTIAFGRQSWKDLGAKLGRLGKISYLPFEIIRLEIKGQQFEFSPPRREIFMADWERHGHKNFSAEFDYKLSPEQALARRDFTINSMGIRFLREGGVTLVDPLGGLDHLQKKLLSPCGPDFGKDPVRFLRAHRFKVKLGLEFTQELRVILDGMPVESLSSHYVWEEMQKSQSPFLFLRSILEAVRLKTLPLGQERFHQWQELQKLVLAPEKHESWVIGLELLGVDSEPWQRYFNVGGESLRKLSRWAKSSKEFLGLRPEMFHGEFDEVKRHKDFETLFTWYFTTKQLLQKNPALPLLSIIAERLPEWIHLYRFEPLKDLGHIDPPDRARYQLWNLCQRL